MSSCKKVEATEDEQWNHLSFRSYI
ncbi:unnamed protein product [Calypogeia fissa]